MIRNYGHGSYVNCEPDPDDEECLFGDDRRQQWRIKEMKKKGQYVYVLPFIELPDQTVFWHCM